MMTLWRRVMTPIQAARVSVTAYPIIQVDMLAVIKCVAGPCAASGFRLVLQLMISSD